MKITSTHWPDFKDVSIADAIRGTIDDAAYDEGSLERIQSKLDKTSEILGQLIQVLNETDRLSDAKIADMLGYHYRVEE